MKDADLFGSQCLKLLSDAATTAILIHLRDGPAPAKSLLDLGTGLGYPTLMSRVRMLIRHGLLDRGTHLGLLTAGRAALSVVDVAAAREVEWKTHRPRFAPPGTRALSVAQDTRWRGIARVLAHERGRVRDLETLLPRVAHGTLERRIRGRRSEGLIVSEKDGRDVWHSLSDSGRRLAGLGLHAARWEWIFGQRDKGLLSSDLAGIIHQLAPLVLLPQNIKGVCALREDWHTTVDGDVYLAVTGGRVSPYVVAPLGPPDVAAHGSPQQWAHALVTGDATTLSCSGDEQLLRGLVDGLHREVRA